MEMPYSPRLRWPMIALVFLATAIIYVDRQALSIVAPILINLYHMSNGMYSRIVFAFMIAYTLMNGISGPLIDRLGTRRGYALTTLWWSISAALHAVTTGAWSLAVFRFLLGMGEAGNWPAGVKVVAEWFPVEERALASGIFNSGSAIGAIFAPPFIVWVVLKFGWRAAFLAVSASDPGEIYAYDIALRDRDHTFKAGHRIMVQIQSSLFPVIDRNPQTYVPSIYEAVQADFRPRRRACSGPPDTPRTSACRSTRDRQSHCPNGISSVADLQIDADGPRLIRHPAVDRRNVDRLCHIVGQNRQFVGEIVAEQERREAVGGRVPRARSPASSPADCCA